MNLKRKDFVICLCWGIALFTGFTVFVSASNNSTLWSFSNTILKMVNYFPKDITLADWPMKQTIISNFCTTALKPEVISAFWSFYPWSDPRQSIFLTLMCSKSDVKSNFSPFMSAGAKGEEDRYLKTHSIKLLAPQNAACYGSEFQVGCDIARLSEEIITLILEELTTVKQWNLYGVTMNNLSSNKSLEENINTFTKEKLLIHYVSQQNFCKSKTQGYPETCKIMQQSMRAFQKAFSKFRLLNVESLLAKDIDSFKEKQAICTKNTSAEDYDHMFCEIMGRTDEGLDPFITRIYTELFRYQLFATYYTSHLWNKDLAEMSDASYYEFIRIQDFQKNLMPTINTTLKQLADLQNTYPLHIWMLAYQEELLRLRDKYLSKLVAPFYSVFYKLQNVQIKS